MIRCALALMRRPPMSTPRRRSSSISSVSTPGSMTTPLPITHSVPRCRMPEGIRCSLNVSPSRMIVWPALLPPWKRTTASARSASRSVTFPFPSSPHWAPMTTSPGMRPCRIGRRSERGAILRQQVHELGKLAAEDELDPVDRAVAVLGDDELRDARFLGLLRVVVLVAVDEHDEVRVLLDGAGLAQVGEDRALVGARLDAAVELAQRDDRHVDLARGQLEPAAHLADLLDAAFDPLVGVHELEVVDDDQAEVLLGGEPARLGPDLEQAGA